jgi:hypothetical protein
MPFARRTAKTLDGIRALAAELNESYASARGMSLATNHWWVRDRARGRAHELLFAELEWRSRRVDTYWARVGGAIPQARVRSSGRARGSCT